MTDVNEKKKTQLAAIYRRMNLTEIRRRIAEGTLAPLAQQVAESEIERRFRPDHESSKAPGSELTNPVNEVIVIAAAEVVVLTLVWLFASKELFSLILITGLPLFFAPLGKLYPRVSLVIGAMIATLPVVALIWGYHDMSARKSQSLEWIIFWIVIFLFSAICCGIGGSLLMGARHKGSWRNFKCRLEQLKADQRKILRRWGR